MQHDDDQKSDQIYYIAVEDKGSRIAEELNKLWSPLWRYKWFVVIFCLLITLSVGIICKSTIKPKFISSVSLSVSIYAIGGIDQFLRSPALKDKLNLNKISFNEKFSYNYGKVDDLRHKLVLIWMDDSEMPSRQHLQIIINNLHLF